MNLITPQTIYILAILISAILSALVGVLALRYRDKSPGIQFFSPMMFMVAEWQITSIGVCLSPGNELTMDWIYARYVGLILMVPCFMVYTLYYTGKDKWIGGKKILLLFLIPAISIVVTYTNDWHGLMIKAIHYSWDGPLLYVDRVDYGAYFYLHTVYCYALVLICIGMLLELAVRTFRFFRNQALFLIIGIVPLVFFSFLDAFLLVPDFKQALSPFGYAWMGIVLFISIRSMHLLNVVPIARDKLIEKMDDGMLVLNEQGVILDINPAALAILDVESTRLVGTNIACLLPKVPKINDLIEERISSPVEVMLQDEYVQRYFELRSTLLLDQANKRMGRLIIFRDVTKNKEMETELQTSNEKLLQQLSEINRLHAMLKEQVIRDPLTGLLNRRYLGENLRRKNNRAAAVSYLMIDIDHFKVINDTYGHSAGDQILISLGENLMNQVRENDLVYRYGGEEFLIVMEGIDLEQAVERAEAIRKKIGNQAFLLEQGRAEITLSIGVATCTNSGDDPEKVIDQADVALYRAKAKGRNCVCGIERNEEFSPDRGES